MTRLPAGLSPCDDVLAPFVGVHVIYHRSLSGTPPCGADVPLLTAGAYRMPALSGSPCPQCWPDPLGLGITGSSRSFVSSPAA